MIKVKHGRSSSTLAYASDGLLHLDRVISTPVQLDDIDAYGGFSLFAYAECNPGQVSFKYEGRWNELYGKAAILVPPFAVVQWRIRPGRLRFRAGIRPDTGSDTRPVVFRMSELPDDLTMAALTEFLGKNTGEQLRYEQAPVLVQRAKALIDQAYLDECSITRIAGELGIDGAYLSRTFKAWYGIPPVGYRNRLRVFHSKFELVRGEGSVAHAGYGAGFDDLASFNKQFKKVISGVPSQFKPN